MKKYIKLYALLMAALFVSACDDDFGKGNEPVRIISGNEIPFGVTARTGNGGKSTRTAYGAVVDDVIEVNWVKGDKLTITSPEAGGAANGVATYQVEDVMTTLIPGSNSKATTLEKIGDAGLQWTNAEEYNFYAMYPSVESFSSDERANVDINPVGSSDHAFPHMQGWLPVAQAPKGKVEADANGVYTIAPDMRYAFMTANAHYKIKNESGEANDKPVFLEFNSLTTAIQFELQAADLLVNGNNPSTSIEIQSVTLSSKNGHPICGGFVYNYNTKEIEADDAANEGLDLSSITMDLVSKDIALSTKPNGTESETNNNVTTTYNKYKGEGKLNLTFFLLPTYKQFVDEGDLQLKVIYKVNGVMQGKTATVNAEIKPSWKHYFGGLQLPKIKLGDPQAASASNWFSLLNDKIYISQLSFVVAGNAFSNGSVDQYKEQVHDYETLWNMGVRGFEICTYNNNDSKTTSIGTSPIISGGQKVGSLTVSGVFENLYGKLKQSDETLVLIFTGRHMEGLGSFNPDVFVGQLTTYLDEFLGKYSVNPEDLFVKLGSKSCVGDLKGKIAVIVRPGDNDYVKAVKATVANVDKNWKDYITVIDDWGTAEDQWGDRYSTENTRYYDAETYKAAGGKSIFESSCLKWQVRSKGHLSSTWDVYQENVNTPSKVEAKDKKYNRMVNNDSTDIAYVQCWERVVQNETDFKQLDQNIVLTKTYRLYIKWFESYTEKTEMAEYILEQAMSYKGKEYSPLFINGLCGFFINDNMTMSYQPLLSGSASFGENSFSQDKAGTGGDFKSCAANLNYWMYNKLINSTEQGPYGIVMLDYIGATDSHFSSGLVVKETGLDAASAAEACQNLPALIMMNNFKFPLAINPDYGKSKATTVKLSEETISPEVDILEWKK